MNKRGVGLIAALLLGTGQAAAHDAVECGTGPSWTERLKPAFYMGGGLERSSFEDWAFAAKFDSNSYTSTRASEDDTGYALRAGVDFLEHFGLEASYVDFGEASFMGQSDGSGQIWGPGPQRESMSLDGYALHALGRYPIAGSVAVMAKVGYWRWQSERRREGTYYASYTNGVPDPAVPYASTLSDDGWRFTYGAGLEYDGFKPFRVAAEYTVSEFVPGFFDQDPGEARSIGISLKYLF
jgi:OOP family OmpA-OmpF porin